jgi:dCTP deaminase
LVINDWELLEAAPIKNMLDRKVREHGVSHGLAEVGYDIRVKQGVHFHCRKDRSGQTVAVDAYIAEPGEYATCLPNQRFTIASAIEEFDMPLDLVGIVHDKSTWARKGLSVFNTVIEPGWKGFLTLELVYHGQESLIIPTGAGIAQVIFHRTSVPRSYMGKYNHQADRPVAAILEG